MTDRAASNTAAGVAWLNAAHQVIDSSPRILDDPVIVRLVGATVEAISERRDRFQSPGARALRSHVVLRSRFAEERLAKAVDGGVRQYVILGAGLDTFAYRQPDWASGIRIFEVDQPATQLVKRQRVAAASLLTEPAIDAVLRTIASLPRSSEIVFTFAQPRTPDPDTSGGPSLAERAAAMGEPWVTFFEPAALERMLVAFGFSSVGFLSVDEANERYFRDRIDALPPPQRGSIAFATV